MVSSQWCPFVVNADLEAIDVPSDNGCQQTRKTSHTTEIEKQYPANFGAVLVDQRSSSIISFCEGKDCIDGLMDTLRRWLPWTYLQKRKHRQLKLSQSERVLYLWRQGVSLSQSRASLPSHGFRFWDGSF